MPVQPSSGSTVPKPLPRNFFDCSTSDIIVLVSSMLQELVVLNDALPFDPQNLTRFHSRSQPPISILDYLVRIAKFCSLEKSIILAMIYYIDLLCTTYKTFNINSLTIHRFLITSAMVASKGLCDTFCTNTYYAKVGGLPRAELNLLEVEFLIRVNYRIVPPADRLNQYFESMVKRMSNKYTFQDLVPRLLPQNAAPGESSNTKKSNDTNKQTSKHLKPSQPKRSDTILSKNASFKNPTRHSTDNKTHHRSVHRSAHKGKVSLEPEVILQEGQTKSSPSLKRGSVPQENTATKKR